MSSTEHSTGHFGKKSSRVLKPPGGGSSITFGSEEPSASAISGNPPAQTPEAQTKDDSSTQKRLFGCTSTGFQEASATPQKEKTSINVPGTPSSISKKKYVYRNPITGEGISSPPKKKSVNPEKENEKEVEAKDSEKEVEASREEPPAQVIQTSIRVRNPPGGKSSGIW